MGKIILEIDTQTGQVSRRLACKGDEESDVFAFYVGISEAVNLLIRAVGFAYVAVQEDEPDLDVGEKAVSA